MKTITSLILTIFISTLGFGQSYSEKLDLNLPSADSWKEISNQLDGSVHLVEYIPEKEKVKNWSIIVTKMRIDKITGVPMDVAIDMMYKQALQVSPNSKVTVFAKDERAKNHWTLFKIESPNFTDDKTPESQLYYIIQGETALFTNIVAKKEKELDEDFVAKWSKVFKSSTLTKE